MKIFLLQKILNSKLIISALIFIFAFSALCEGRLPPHKLTTLDGKTVSLDNLPGELNVINFWASWCGPCKKELPEINEIAKSYEDSKVFFIAVNEDEKKGAMDSFLKLNPLEMAVAEDTGHALAAKLGVNSLPILVIADKKGNVLHVQNGYTPGDGKRLERKIISLLNK